MINSIFSGLSQRISQKTNITNRAVSASLTETNSLLMDIRRQLSVDYSRRINDERSENIINRKRVSKEKFLLKENLVETIKSIGSNVGKAVISPFNKSISNLGNVLRNLLLSIGVNAAFKWLSKKENLENLNEWVNTISSKWKEILGIITGLGGLFAIGKLIGPLMTLKRIFTFLSLPRVLGAMGILFAIKESPQFGDKLREIGDKLDEMSKNQEGLPKTGLEILSKALEGSGIVSDIFTSPIKGLMEIIKSGGNITKSNEVMEERDRILRENIREFLFNLKIPGLKIPETPGSFGTSGLYDIKIENWKKILGETFQGVRQLFNESPKNTTNGNGVNAEPVRIKVEPYSTQSFKPSGNNFSTAFLTLPPEILQSPPSIQAIPTSTEGDISVPTVTSFDSANPYVVQISKEIYGMFA